MYLLLCESHVEVLNVQLKVSENSVSRLYCLVPFLFCIPIQHFINNLLSHKKKKMKVNRSVREKKAIVAEANSMPNNLKPTARKYNIEPYLIRRWKKLIIEREAAANPEELEEMTREDMRKSLRKKADHSGSLGTLALADRVHLMDHFASLRRGGNIVTVVMMTLELIRLHPALADLHFNVVKMRVHRFCLRNKLVPRRTTHTAQNHVYNDDVIAAWKSYVCREILINRYSPAVVVSMDETNVDFDIMAKSTLSVRGARSINVRSMGSSERCTVILAVTASGEKLKPFLIFKGVPGARSRIAQEFQNPALGYPQDLVYTVQPKAWNDSDTMMQWINLVWRPFCVEKGLPTYLIWDEFSVHLMRQTVHAVQESGTQVDFVPGGYTGAVQILDKGINKPFKDYIKREQIQFMIDNPQLKPRRHQVANWIATSWQRVSVETITNTWRSVLGEW